MKIPIQSAHLTDAPYTAAQAGAFLFDDQHMVDQLVLELQYGLAGAYLVSGYRGSGKTSFINRLDDGLTDFIFIELNVSKATPYPVLLKRIIRQLYLEYQSYCQKQKKTAADFMPEFQLLYDRTFNEITQVNLDSEKSELKTERQGKFDLTKLKEPLTKLFAPVVLGLFSGAGLLAHLTSAVLLVLLLIASVVWTLLSAWTLTTTQTDTNTKSSDLSRKSLYDDEIAEYHLFALLQKMRDKNIQLVLVFDELDKLETNDEVKAVVNDLKPLLLSGYTHCLVVAGQALYYDLEKSAYLDDIVISSLFSRTIHVAFLKNATLKKFCLSLVIKKENESIKQIVSDYFDALILQSGRIPRKLVNAIRSCLVWEKDQAYIEIDETQQEKFRWRARVLQAAASVVDNDLATRARNNVQLDFFTAQVFGWLGKMITYDSTSFQRSNIYNTENYGDIYPLNWIEELDIVWNALFEGLKKKGYWPVPIRLTVTVEALVSTGYLRHR